MGPDPALLAVLRLRARDLVGFTFLQFVFHLPVASTANNAAVTADP